MYHVWSERYDRDLNDIFAVQDEIASAIAEALKLKLSPDSKRTYQPSRPAYEAFLRSRYHLMRYTAEDFKVARTLLGRAIEFDPNYAAAHSGLASYYNNMAIEESARPHDVVPLARVCCSKALQLDPTRQTRTMLWDSSPQHTTTTGRKHANITHAP